MRYFNSLLGALFGILMLPGIGCTSEDTEHAELIVFAAASLTDVSEALGEAFEEQHPTVEVVVSMGASSTLARQIARGAPADLFLSASPEWTAYLTEQGRLADDPITLAGNRLVVLGREGAPAISSPRDLLRFARIAIADPSHVPAGQYSREALHAAGLWEEVQSKLIPTLDVRAAVAALDQGAVEAAIVYATDALVAPHLPAILVWPENVQPSIEISGARMTGTGSEAAAFLSFLAEPEQRATWIEFGFDMPAHEQEPAHEQKEAP